MRKLVFIVGRALAGYYAAILLLGLLWFPPTLAAFIDLALILGLTMAAAWTDRPELRATGLVFALVGFAGLSGKIIRAALREPAFQNADFTWWLLVALALALFVLRIWPRSEAQQGVPADVARPAGERRG